MYTRLASTSEIHLSLEYWDCRYTSTYLVKIFLMLHLNSKQNTSFENSICNTELETASMNFLCLDT